MKKSFAKRIRVTRNGKMLRRQMGLGHFRSKRSAPQLQSKKHFSTIASGYTQKFQEFLSSKK